MTSEEIRARLAEPFPAEDVQWRPGSVTKDGSKAMALAYVDARAVQDRLDAVLGPGGWQSSFEFLPDGCAICTLQALIGGFWIKRQDVGAPSEQKDPGDVRKAAISDALKRAAVQLGIGRYLYSIDSPWHPIDQYKRLCKPLPQLPDWALPRKVISQDVREAGLALLRPAVDKGMQALELMWKTITPAQREACKGDLPELKKEAARAGTAA